MGDWIKRELTRSYERATKTGEARVARQPRAVKAHYDGRKSRLVIELTNGVILMLPPAADELSPMLVGRLGSSPPHRSSLRP
jgi:hypothetical protein